MVAAMRLTAPRWAAPWIVMAIAMALLAGCASGPQRMQGGPSTAPGRDGPETNPPPDLARVPDAEPQVEPIRAGGPNKPYELLGRSYVPITRDAPFTERGIASWYGRPFHGRRTASGEVYNMYAMTAAHPTLPIPSYARVRNPANGREIVVRINDRGPFHGGRILDLSYTAALKLDLHRGIGAVELQRITFDDIRTGAWRREATTVLAAGPSPVPAPVPAPAAAPLPAAASEPAATPPPADVAAPLAPTPVVATVTIAEPVADAPSARAYTAPARGFWVQLGAFRQRDGAESFQQRVVAELDWLSPLLAVFSDEAMFRLQAGPYPSRNEARLAAERIRDGLRLVPVIVERR
jgi:rare lipoprotein A